MKRLVCLSITLALSIAAVHAQTTPAPKKPKPVWHGYGFLPGYRQPPSNSQPIYAQRGVSRKSPRDKRPWYIDPTPGYFDYEGNLRYFGWPSFYRGHYNGGTYGPCWTRTPVGPVWTCG